MMEHHWNYQVEFGVFLFSPPHREGRSPAFLESVNCMYTWIWDGTMTSDQIQKLLSCWIGKPVRNWELVDGFPAANRCSRIQRDFTCTWVIKVWTTASLLSRAHGRDKMVVFEKTGVAAAIENVKIAFLDHGYVMSVVDDGSIGS